MDIRAKIQGLTEFLSRRSGTILIVAVVTGFVIRVASIFAIGNLDEPEMYEHGKIAHNLMDSGRFAMHWPYPSTDEDRLAMQQKAPPFSGAFIPPLNPWILYISLELFGDNSEGYFFYMLLNAILGTLAIYPAYYIALLLGGRRAASLGAILIAAFLPAVYGVTTFSGSQLYHLLALCCIYFAISYILRHRGRDIFLVGLFCGLQTLVRSEFLILSVVIIIVSAVISGLRGENKPKILPFFGALVIFAAITGPWVYRNTRLFGEIVPIVSHPWHEIWRGNNRFSTGGAYGIYGTSIWENETYAPEQIRKLDSIPYDQHFELAADSIFREAAIEYISRNPGEAFLKACKRVLFLWTIDVYTPRAHHPVYIFFIVITIIPAFVAGCKLVRRETLLRNPVSVYLLFALYYSALIFVVNLESRYQVYMLTVVAPLAAIGWDYALVRLSGRNYS